jgi:hypothetical protein
LIHYCSLAQSISSRFKERPSQIIRVASGNGTYKKKPPEIWIRVKTKTRIRLVILVWLNGIGNNVLVDEFFWLKARFTFLIYKKKLIR